MSSKPRSNATSDSSEALIRVPLAQLHPHPRNANVMTTGSRAKLRRNIEREGRYPPLIVRPHPEITSDYEVLDGHQRLTELVSLGHEDALCYPWPCDDATALVLLATLNRLEGEDVPERRTELLGELTHLIDPAELALLLPEDARAISQSLARRSRESGHFLRELQAAAARQAQAGPRLITFAISSEDEAAIEAAIANAGTALEGPNRRGRALGLVCRKYIEDRAGG